MCVYIHIDTLTYIQIHGHTYIHIHLYMCVCVCICVYVFVCVHVFFFTIIATSVCVCVCDGFNAFGSCYMARVQREGMSLGVRMKSHLTECHLMLSMWFYSHSLDFLLRFSFLYLFAPISSIDPGCFVNWSQCLSQKC